MTGIINVIYIVLSVLAFGSFLVNGDHAIDNECLECLCQASSNCNVFGCHKVGKDEQYCGPYQISHPYWLDGGMPGSLSGDKEGFVKCANNKTCAETTVKAYLKRWGRDCNGDGVVDCDDFARMHKAGAFSCTGAWVEDTKYWQTYDLCYYEDR